MAQSCRATQIRERGPRIPTLFVPFGLKEQLLTVHLGDVTSRFHFELLFPGVSIVQLTESSEC